MHGYGLFGLFSAGYQIVKTDFMNGFKFDKIIFNKSLISLLILSNFLRKQT